MINMSSLPTGKGFSKTKRKIDLECDQGFLSSLDSKGNQRWIRLAMDRKNQRGCWVCDQNKEPEDYGTLCHQSIASVVWLYRFLGSLCKCLKNVTGQSVKKLANTSHIERFNNTMRQKFSSSSLNSIFFKLENHIGAILFYSSLQCLLPGLS